MRKDCLDCATVINDSSFQELEEAYSHFLNVLNISKSWKMPRLFPAYF